MQTARLSYSNESPYAQRPKKGDDKTRRWVHVVVPIWPRCGGWNRGMVFKSWQYSVFWEWTSASVFSLRWSSVWNSARHKLEEKVSRHLVTMIGLQWPKYGSSTVGPGQFSCLLPWIVLLSTASSSAIALQGRNHGPVLMSNGHALWYRHSLMLRQSWSTEFRQPTDVLGLYRWTWAYFERRNQVRSRQWSLQYDVSILRLCVNIGYPKRAPRSRSCSLLAYTGFYGSQMKLGVLFEVAIRLFKLPGCPSELLSARRFGVFQSCDLNAPELTVYAYLLAHPANSHLHIQIYNTCQAGMSDTKWQSTQVGASTGPTLFYLINRNTSVLSSSSSAKSWIKSSLRRQSLTSVRQIASSTCRVHQFITVT